MRKQRLIIRPLRKKWEWRIEEFYKSGEPPPYGSLSMGRDYWYLLDQSIWPGDTNSCGVARSKFKAELKARQYLAYKIAQANASKREAKEIERQTIEYKL